MNEKIEQVARALAPLAWAALGTGDTLAHANRRKASLRHARVAIEAMREPTINMVNAGQNVVWKGGARPGPVTVQVVTGTFSDIWKAMCDEILK